MRIIDSHASKIIAVLVVAVATFLGVPTLGATATSVPGSYHDTAFVRAAYHDFLGREPSAAELTQATSHPLDNASARSALVARLSHSPEWIGRTVDELYQNTLGRPADAAGKAYWVHALATGHVTVANAAASFYSSSEYFNGLGGGQRTSWVADLYTKILHRSGKPADVAFWAAEARSHGRWWVAYSFYQSSESRHTRVTALFQDLLGRNPDSGGADHWAKVIRTRGDLALASALAASSEYYRRAWHRFAPTAPGAPTDVKADAGNAQTTVTWQAPLDNGGAPIEGYTVTSNPGSFSCTTTTATSCTVTGLTNTTPYTFTVTAHSAFGVSAPSAVAGPVTPTLLGWSPPAGAVPDHGTALYLQSSPGDFVGAGKTYLYTLANSVITFEPVGHSFGLHVDDGSGWWLNGTGAPSGVSGFTTGYWQNLDRFQFDFSGHGRGCNTDATDIQIDDVEYDTSGALQHLTMRFLQHCEETGPPLRGYFRYDATDTTTPPPPGNPADFTWHPPTGAVPATGDYLYLQGSPGDFVTNGQTILLDADNGTAPTLSNIYGKARNVGVSVPTPDFWNVWMFGQESQARLTPGLYSNVQRAPFNNPTAGGFSVYGYRGCNASFSTFAVDSIGYDTAGNVTSISARFVQHCESPTAPPLYGSVRIG